MAEPARIVILGGGFAGAAGARRLERLVGRDASVEIPLVEATGPAAFLGAPESALHSFERLGYA